MPFNHTQMEERLKNCDLKLKAIFADEIVQEALQKHIKEVQKYYNLSYTKAKKTKTVEDILKTYEFYIDQLAQVQAGDLSYKKMQKSIDSANDARRASVFCADLAKAAELIFWAATAITLYAAIFLIALPMLMVQTPLGVTLLIAIGGLLIASAVNCFNCLTEFKTFTRHDEEYLHEGSLLSFFQPAKVTSTDSEEFENNPSVT